ncbi:hypothetical protein [Sphingobacterium deserti]|uniref:Uncharacterized protein n=1 Tax=Sphingobacterium deserti TaxID=1229276 RepID=A0A0B8T3C8_9SPHI|nr:hypothetical protein [Sphingobacterium deserti]KGE15591.1 hypothetical protein DI53_0695 [Sphingobacterium deserti]
MGRWTGVFFECSSRALRDRFESCSGLVRHSFGTASGELRGGFDGASGACRTIVEQQSKKFRVNFDGEARITENDKEECAKKI